MNDRIQWDDVRCFLEVAAAGSMTAAASRAGLSVATVARRVEALERSQDLVLLHRRPSGAELSDAGRRIAEVAAAGAEHLAQLPRVARALRTAPAVEPVRVSATAAMVEEVLAPALQAFVAANPGVPIVLTVANQAVNLHRREADLAIRMVRPTDETLLARKLPAVEIALFASAAYLGGRKPDAINLHEERLLGFDDTFGDIPEVRWMREQELEAQLLLRCTSTTALLRAAVDGIGIALLPRFLARRHRLVEIVAKPVPARQPWLVFHRDLRSVGAVRRVRDWVLAACRDAVA
jgi:DNA-binding transcriptional LysR family regulator